MAAWVAAVDHPFFAVTDAEGRFEIRGLPPGRYSLEVWHEAYRGTSREIEVKGKDPVSVDFPLKDRNE